MTIELVARFVVLATSASLALGVAGVLARTLLSRRPMPAERLGGPIGYVNHAGLAGFMLLGALVATTGVTAVDVAEWPLANALRLGGVVLLWAGGLLAAWGGRAMGRHLVGAAEVRPDTELVTDGPFGLVRHPMYDSILLLWAGGGCALLSPAFAAGLVVLVPGLWLRARAEERLLVRHFGAAYESYAARVPMLVPRPGRRG
jgi:protein-S-isoprenylcysteine O-methyltransferase Ste14